MAAKKRILKPPIDWYDIKTAKDALRWLREGNEPSWSQARSLAERFDKTLKLDGSSFGTDDGNTDLVAISNYRVWKRDFEKSEGKIWWDLDGAILLRIDKDSPEKEAHDSLESDYPVLDDSDHGELEYETQQENWNDYGRSDLRRTIVDKAAASDTAAVESLLEFLSDSEFDEIVHEIWNDTDSYPEQESGSSSTNFPNIVSGWDGSLFELGKLFSLDKRGYYVEIKLTPAAYDRNNRIILRPVDLPNENLLPLLISDEAIYLDNFDQAVCDSPYFVCGWVKKPPERQMRLPGVSEKRRSRAV